MPKTHVTRSIELEKSASEVFPLISEFPNWPQGSPWSIVEPEGKLTSAPPFSISHDWNMGKGTCRYTPGYPVEHMPRT